MTDTKYTDTDINIEKESTKHIQRNKKEKKTIHNISMAKRNQDIEQLKEFANEIAWLEAKLIQQREAREDNNTNSNKKNKKKSKKKKLRNIKTSRSESEITVKNKWISGQSEQPETTDNDNGIINENDDGIVPEISKAAKKISKRRRKLRKLKIKHQIPKWKARRAKSTVERLMEFKDKGGKADINAKLVSSPIVTVVKKTVAEQTMAMELLSSPTWLREEQELMNNLSIIHLFKLDNHL